MPLNDSGLRANPLNKLVFKFIDDAKHIFDNLDKFSGDDKKRFVNEVKGFFQFCPNQNMYLQPNLLLICDYPPPAVLSGLFNTPATKRLFTVLESLGIRALMVDRLPIAIKPRPADPETGEMFILKDNKECLNK